MEAWYDAEEDLEPAGSAVAAERGQDPAVVNKDVTNRKWSQSTTQSISTIDCLYCNAVFFITSDYVSLNSFCESWIFEKCLFPVFVFGMPPFKDCHLTPGILWHHKKLCLMLSDHVGITWVIRHKCVGFMTARLHTVIKAKEHRDILKFMYIFHFSLKM